MQRRGVKLFRSKLVELVQVGFPACVNAKQTDAYAGLPVNTQVVYRQGPDILAKLPIGHARKG